ncbi:acyltransferase family protein [Vibrio cyclitrophicus]|uniref:acyltransferase family protein n=1 Tax=Vibrio cyclitrophicus TaxID=47951 RepID=UPI000C863801|nr:acyltransferase [Vibrio cyclitrophicus]
MKFRKDINGLRAIAVIAVVLFHFDANWLPGGFAGVDVFFVISGFLMTGIIFNGLEQGNFSVLKFYISRANRIIPALSFLCIVLLFLGWFYLTPIDYSMLGKHVVSSMSFISNIIYWREAGYFDSASHDKWLLHTWSLSVEWQFYVIYPILLVVIKRFMSYQNMKVFILLATVSGFIFSVLVTYKWPNPSYYLLPTRAWEMMLGGVAYLFPLKIDDYRKKIIEWLGVALILISYFFISQENLWPGYLALLPVMGAFLVIQAQRHDSIITGNIIFQYLGKWSYSIYLWHWPLVVVIFYLSLDKSFVYVGILMSIFLGFISNKYIEGFKFRNDFGFPMGYINCKPILLSIGISLLGMGSYLTQGFEWHYSEEVISASRDSIDKNPYNCMVDNIFPCYIGNSSHVKAIIIGDSHADALTTSLASVFDLNKYGIISLTKSSCPFILGLKSTKSGDDCLVENNRRLKFLKMNYPDVPIFWVARSAAYIYGQSNPERVTSIVDTKPSIYFSNVKYKDFNTDLLDEFSAALRETISQINNRNVYLVLPTPEMRVNVPKKLGRSLLFGDLIGPISIDKSLYDDRNKEIIKILRELQNLENVVALDPTEYLCRENICYGQNDGRSIYYDGDHLSEYGNKLLTPMFEKNFIRL